MEKAHLTAYSLEEIGQRYNGKMTPAKHLPRHSLGLSLWPLLSFAAAAILHSCIAVEPVLDGGQMIKTLTAQHNSSADWFTVTPRLQFTDFFEDEDGKAAHRRLHIVLDGCGGVAKLDGGSCPERHPCQYRDSA